MADRTTLYCVKKRPTEISMPTCSIGSGILKPPQFSNTTSSQTGSLAGVLPLAQDASNQQTEFSVRTDTDVIQNCPRRQTNDEQCTCNLLVMFEATLVL